MADDEHNDDLHPMSQDEIDALFAEAMGDTGAKPPEGEADDDEAPAGDAEAASAEAGSDSGASAQAEAPEEPEGAGESSDAAASIEPEQPAADVAKKSGTSVGTGSASAPSADEDDAIEGSSIAAGAKVSQSDIDALLAELGGGGGDDQADDDDEGVASAVATAAQPTPPGEVPPTSSITAENLAELIDKHADDDPEESSGTAGGTSAMIGQSDIDALVAQMASAGGDDDDESGGSVARDQMETMVAEDPDDFAALFEQAGSGSNRSVADAVSPSLIRDVVANREGGVAPLQGAVMSSEELRGTRYLLVAAVFLLMMCAVTLGFVVTSINGLTAELARDNESDTAAGDDFAEDMAVAERWLTASDPVTVTKGVNFLEDELKDRYPRKREVIAERLARHYRSVGAHREAVREFAHIADREAGLLDDPEFYLHYADSLARIGEDARARQVAYELIANEAWFLRERLSDGEAVPAATIARHRDILRRGKILLGRLYSPVIADEGPLAMVEGP